MKCSIYFILYILQYKAQGQNPVILLCCSTLFGASDFHLFISIFLYLFQGWNWITITSRKDAFSGSSNLLKGPSFTVKPLLQKTMLWITVSGCWGAVGTNSPESNLPVPVKLLELDEGFIMGPSTAPNCLAWLKIASTSLPFEGSWTSIPLQTLLLPILVNHHAFVKIILTFD